MLRPHTPGPWKLDRSGYVESPSTGLPICKMMDGSSLESKQRSRSNGQIIAAAPDMLSAINDARNLIAQAMRNGAWGSESSDDTDSADEAMSVLTAVEKAIAKATGCA
jgi:hypothetical protein